MNARELEKLRHEVDVADTNFRNAQSKRICLEQRAIFVPERLRKVNDELEKLSSEKLALETEAATLEKMLAHWSKQEIVRKEQLARLRNHPMMQRLAALEREVLELKAKLKNHPLPVVRDAVSPKTKEV